MNQPTDAQLVAGTVAGDSEAFAAMYDRYSAALYDVASSMLRDPHDAADAVQDVFLIASERLSQLREPDRLRAWLFAVLRNDVYRRSKSRQRVRPTDQVIDLTSSHTADEEGGRVEYEELAAFVRDAAAGLDDRDRLVLELSVRQGLQGADLAEALGVSASQSYSLVHRMRDRTERSLGALLVARTNRRECEELDSMLADWDGTFSVLIRKRVARHVQQCANCDEQTRRRPVLAMFAAAPAWALPLGLRGAVLDQFTAGSPTSAADVPSAAGAGGELEWDDRGFPAANGSNHLALVPGALRPRRPVRLLAAVGVVVLVGAIAAVVASAKSNPTTVVAGAAETASPTTSAPAVGAPAASGATTSVADGQPAATATTLSSASTTPGTALAAPAPVPQSTVGPLAPGTTAAVTPTIVVAPVVTPAPTARPGSPAVTQPQPPRTTAVAPSTTVVRPEPGSVEVNPRSVTVGATQRSAVFDVHNVGSGRLEWTAATNVGFVNVSPRSGILEAGELTVVTATTDRSGVPEGTAAALVSISGPTNVATVTMMVTVERPPVLTVGLNPPNPSLVVLSRTCSSNAATSVSVEAAVSDESSVAEVALHWIDARGATGVRTMVWRETRYVAVLGPFSSSGSVEYWVGATDVRKNTGLSGRRKIEIQPCR